MIILFIVVGLVIIVVSLLLFRIINTSDLGEGSLTLSEEEYNELCEEYNKFYNTVNSKFYKDYKDYKERKN